MPTNESTQEKIDRLIDERDAFDLQIGQLEKFIEQEEKYYAAFLEGYRKTTVCALRAAERLKENGLEYKDVLPLSADWRKA